MNTKSYPVLIQKALDKVAVDRFSLPEDYLATCQTILSYAEEIGSDSLTGTACFYFAEYYYKHPESYDKFYQYLRRAILHLDNQADDLYILARCYNFLGINATDHGQTELAFDYYIQAVFHAREADSKQLEAICEYNIGTQYDQMGQQEEGQRHYKRAVNLIKACGTDDPYYFTVYSYCLCQAVLYYVTRQDTALMEVAMRDLQSLIHTLPDHEREEVYIDTLYLQATIAYAYKTDHKDDLFRLSRTLIQQLEKEALKIDDLSDILTFAGFILESGYPSPVREILDILMPQVNQCNIPFIRQSLARLAIKYYRYVGNVEKELEAFRLYYDATESYMAETNKEYVYFLNLRNDLDELRAKNAHLLQQATTDALTGLPNRLAFNEASERAFDKAYVGQTTLAVEILDIDDFKHFNDTLGHQNGDLYLKTFGTLLSSVQKEGITAFRYGGDEFVLLYEGMSDEEILAVATGIKEKVTSLSITADNGDLLPGMTISQGICQSIPKGKNRTWDFLYAADHALYDVKRKNKNDVSLMNELIPMPERFRS
ncbi:MAG: GGDEF domain-containing protein [Lachnospiraceae bacterium]|nr:GGDEF domain-containing protein [Lachnospiraceae bacterium]